MISLPLLSDRKLKLMPGEPIATEQLAIDFAHKLLEAWRPETFVLERIDKRQNWYWVDGEKRTLLLLTFVPEYNGIPVLTRGVEFEFDLDQGKLVSFHAAPFYFTFNDDLSTNPLLSPQEAVKKLNPYLRVAGEPRLIVDFGGKGREVLMYRIPIEGVPAVSHVDINAINGHEEGYRLYLD